MLSPVPTGGRNEARQILRRLQANARTGVHDPPVATVLLALDDLEVDDRLPRAELAERHPQLRFIAGNPIFRSIEVEPRYIDLRRRARERH
jgi:hypothetical protein